MRRAGILLHPTSLPGPGPCGDLGDGATRFLEFLRAAGCSLWQVLPLCPAGGGFSPYASRGARVGGTHLISVDLLQQEGLLGKDEIWPRPRTLGRVDVDALDEWHAPLVLRAAGRAAAADPAGLDAFAAANPAAMDWAVYQVLCRDHGGGWPTFPAPLRDRQPDALARFLETRRADVRAELAAQWLFRRQWDAVHGAARAMGIQIVGDLPIYVAGDGVDVWVYRDLFRWGRDGSADPLSGVPPDYFSPTGQFWGNPMYDWKRHKATGYAWWVARFQDAFALCDTVRVDHFRGFAAAWAVPASARGDARLGAWEKGPGAALFKAVREAHGSLPIIAEDLGVITPDVEALRDGLELPGMKVLQFAFTGGPDHPFLPHNYDSPRWVAYTGTHDNDTARGWYQSAPEGEKHQYRVYAGRDGGEPHWDLIRLAWASVARWAVAPMQDVLGLGSDSRMNTPGLPRGNWTWRAPVLPEDAAWRLRSLSEAYGRLP